MPTYIPTAINEKAFDQARQDAVASYAPQGVVLSSGFLAGFLAAWLPGIVGLPLLFAYRFAFGAKPWMSAAEKKSAAVADLTANAQAYATVAIWAAIVLGVYGIVQALLRQRSTMANTYVQMEFSKYGEVRLGREAQLTILGFPIVSVIYLWLADRLTVLVVTIPIVVLSGFFYHILWTRLDNWFLSMLYRRRFEERTALALRVMIPRHVGWDKCKIGKVEVDQTSKSVRVEGEFGSDFAEKEARNVIGHFMRGYHPIYLVNTRKTA